MRIFLLLFVALFLTSGIADCAFANEFVRIPGGDFRSVIPEGEGDDSVAVDECFLKEAPVSNAEFLRFVLHHPQWQRGEAVSLFVDDQYLSKWSGPISLGPASGPQQPVTQVS